MSILGPLIGAGGSFLSGIAGGLLGNSSTKSTNRTNLQIAREQNAFNQSMWNQQRDYNTQMYLQQRDYNTPLAQRQRYEEAGYNPYLVSGQITPGTMESPVAPNAQPAAGAVMQPSDYSYVQNSVNNSIRTFFDTQMQEQGVRQAQARADIEASQAAFAKRKAELDIMDLEEQIANRKADTSLKKSQKGNVESQTDYTNANTDFLNQTWNAQIKQQDALAYKTQVEAELTDLKKTTETLNHDLLKFKINVENPQRLALDLAVGAAQVKLMASQQNLNDKQARLAYENMVKVVLEQSGVDMDNVIKSEALPNLVSALEATSFGNGFLGNALGTFYAAYYSTQGNRDKLRAHKSKGGYNYKPRFSSSNKK